MSHDPSPVKRGFDAFVRNADPGQPASSAQAGLDHNFCFFVDFLKIDFKSLPNDKILDLMKSKAFADDKMKLA